MLTATVTIIHKSHLNFALGLLSDIVHNSLRQIAAAVGGKDVDLVKLEAQLDLCTIGDDAGNGALFHNPG